MPLVEVLAELARLLEEFGERSSIERMSADVRMMELGKKTQNPVGDACRPF